MAIAPTSARFPADYWAKIEPGVTSDPAVTDVGFAAKQRLKELFREGVDYYARIGVESVDERLERLRRKRDERFGPSVGVGAKNREPGDAERVSGLGGLLTTRNLVIAAVVGLGVYLLLKKR